MAIRAPRQARNAGVSKTRREIDLTVDDPDDFPSDLDLSQPVDIEELWKHRAELHKLCARIVGDPITADDMVQETYLRALRHRDRLENRPSLMPWLATVARRRSLDELRSRSRATPFEFVPDSPSGPDDDPECRVPGAEAVAKVKNAFGTLNDRERDLLTRQIEEGLSLSDLAEEENSSVDAVRSVLVRARAKLRHAVGDDAIFPVAAPVGTLGLWLRAMRDRANAFSFRMQRTFAAAPVERVGELLTAGVVTLAVSTGPVGGSSASVSSNDAARASASTSAADAVHGADPATVSGGASDIGVRPSREKAGGPSGLMAAVPGAGAAELVLPPDDVESPEDARFESFSVTGGDGPVVLAAGRRRAGCVTGCTVLFRSDDAGATWSRLPAAGITGSAIAAAPGYPVDPRIFAIGDGGLSVSRDGGESFLPILTVAAGPLAISPAFSAGDQRVFVGSGPALVWDDATRSASPLLGVSVSERSHFAFAPGYPAGSLFVGGSAPGDGDFEAAVYRCGRTLDDDSCVHHTTLAGLATTPQVAALPVRGGQAVFAWAGTRLFRSVDAGVSFSGVPLSDDLHVNAMAADGNGVVFAAAHSASGAGAGAGGIARSADGGATWELLGAGTPLSTGATAVAVLPSGRMIGAPLAAAGGGVVCSVDGGTTWEARCA